MTLTACFTHSTDDHYYDMEARGEVSELPNGDLDVQLATVAEIYGRSVHDRDQDIRNAAEDALISAHDRAMKSALRVKP